MRLKTYTAPTVAEAMDFVRRDMGAEAIIVSTQKGADGQASWVTAAIEDEALAAETEPPAPGPRRGMDEESLAGYLRQVLTAHGLPAHMIQPLVRAALKAGEENPQMALATALDSGIDFRPIDLNGGGRPIVLAGVPGAGKTITAAKLTARAKLNGKRVFAATTDSKRAGGIEQLDAFMRILEIPLTTCDGADDLAQRKAEITATDVAVIDTGGVNPFEGPEMLALAEIARAVGGEIVLVLPAGGDAMESADTAAAFADIGAERIIVTRLDMTRRLGGIMAAGLGRLAIANVSINPKVADGLDLLNPVSLSRLVVPDDETDIQSPQTKVAP